MTVEWWRVYLDALRAGDRKQALAVVEEARGAGLGLSALYLDVFQPALREIGRLWQENEISVAEEHLATAITQIAMGRLYTEFCMATGRSGRTLLAACTETEKHEIGLRMICDLLELQGWDTTYLSAAVPPDILVGMVLRDRPDVLALSASIAPHLPQLRSVIQAVRAATGEAVPYILVGGRPFLDDDTLAQQVGADAMARDTQAAVERLRERFG
ncbi:MAG: cobalamin B12-binding domain-containing protein [Gemmatimonadaceae bacterium]